MNRSALWRAAAVGAVTSFTFTACSSAAEPAGEPAASLAPAPEAQQLADVCPANVGIQLQWQPQSDMGAVFGMLAPATRSTPTTSR